MKAVFGSGIANIGQVPIDNRDVIARLVDIGWTHGVGSRLPPRVPNIIGIAYLQRFGRVAARNRKFRFILADASDARVFEGGIKRVANVLRRRPHIIKPFGRPADGTVSRLLRRQTAGKGRWIGFVHHSLAKIASRRHIRYHVNCRQFTKSVNFLSTESVLRSLQDDC